MNIMYIYGAPEKQDSLISIDTMDEQKGWELSKEEGADGGIINEQGKLNKAVGMKYNLENGNWIQIFKPFDRDLSNMEYIFFDIKTEGKLNNLEFKLVDDDGSNFGTRFNNFNTFGQWKRIKIAVSDLEYFWGGNNKLNLKKVKTIWFAITKAQGGEGKILVDNLEYKTKEDLLKLDGLSSKLLIDNFERSDPYRTYVPVIYDKSDLDLRSVNSYLVEGNYAMEMYYVLSTDKSDPSSVGAFFKMTRPLNWTKVSTVNIWVRGDGSRNIFSIQLVDASNEVWEYDDYQVLYDSEWKLISIPIDRFKLSTKTAVNNKKFDKKTILSIQFLVKGSSTVASKGKVYLDKMYVTGKDMSPQSVIPEAVQKPVILERPQDNVDIGGLGFVEYKWTPELGYILGGYIKLKFDAKVKQFGVFMEMASQDIEYGKATYIEELNGKTYLREKKPSVEITSIQLSIRKPFKYINEIIIGNLFEDFSDYTYSVYHTDYGEWGYKGVKMQGEVDKLNYRMVIIKQLFDSYIYIGELFQKFDLLYLKAIYLFDNNRAHIENSGQLREDEIIDTQEGDFKTDQVFYEKTYTGEMGVDFFKQKLHLSIMAGESYYKRTGEAELKGANDDYIYNYDLPSPKIKVGQFYKAEVQTRSLFWKDFDIYIHVRDVDRDYKPEFRKKPADFDEIQSGGYGGNIRLSQGYMGWRIFGEADEVRRKTNRNYYRKWYRYGLGRYNFYNFEFTLAQEIRLQEDKFYKTRMDQLNTKRENVYAYSFQIGYNITSKLRILEEQKYEIVEHIDAQQQWEALRYYLLMEYYLSHSSKFRIEGVFFKYGQKYWEPHDDPYDDNFYKLILEVNF